MANRCERRRGRLTTQQFWRLVRRLSREKGIGRCHGCGRRFDSPEGTITGLTGDGCALTVGRCCEHRIEVALALGLYCDAKDAPASWLRDIEVQGHG